MTANSLADRVYCTCFDSNYLSRGLALYRSLQRHAAGSRLWVLCLDDACHRYLAKLGLPHLIAVSLAEFEAADPAVAATRPSRSRVEYYFTLTPAWLIHVLDREPKSEWVTYLDGDLYFFDSPARIFDELEAAAFAIIPHRYTPAIESLKKFGVFNVGWVGARNDFDGLASVRWWREQCIQWCYDYVDGERFADQGYLQMIAAWFPRVKAIENVGANLAPWNVGNYRIAFDAGKVWIDATHPLIFFHFQGIKKAFSCFIFNSHRIYRAPFSSTVRDRVYRPYIEELLAIEGEIGPAVDVAHAAPLPRAKAATLRHRIKGAVRTARDRLFRVLDIVTGRAFMIVRGKAY
jgi:hypothetical protein